MNSNNNIRRWLNGLWRRTGVHWVPLSIWWKWRAVRKWSGRVRHTWRRSTQNSLKSIITSLSLGRGMIRTCWQIRGMSTINWLHMVRHNNNRIIVIQIRIILKSRKPLELNQVRRIKSLRNRIINRIQLITILLNNHKYLNILRQ